MAADAVKRRNCRFLDQSPFGRNGMMMFDELCRPRAGNGVQEMMLRWEQQQPVNAAQVAWLKNSFRPSEIEAASARVLQRLLELGSDGGPCRRPGGERLFAFRQATLPGDWRGPLQSAVTDELNTPCRPGESPFRISVFDVPRQGQFVMLAYRHVIADARSIALLLHEIIHQSVDPARGPPEFAPRIGAHSLRELFPAAFHWSRLPAVAWNSINEVWKSRRCRKLPCANQNDLRMEFRIHQFSLPLESQQRLSRELRATFNDLLLASVLEWFAREFPSPRGSRRRELAAATIVDLCGRTAVPQPFVFGQYLSQFVVRAAVTAEMPFEVLVRLVARQTAAGKEITPLLLNVRSFEFLAREWDLLPRVRRPAHLPWALPVLAGVSNVNLGGIVGEAGEALPVRNYFRGTCTTNLLPMMLGITTMRDTCSLTTTHRPAIFTARQMDDLAAHVGERLFRKEVAQQRAAG
jgi:hypothetical protein